MLQDGDVKVAYFYPTPDTSTFRYRCFNTACAINAYVDAMSASWFSNKDDDQHLEVVAKAADTVVICRAAYTGKVARFIQIARRWGARVLFDCDDYVFDYREIPSIVSAQGQVRDGDMESVWNTWFGWAGRLKLVMEMCEGLIVTNDYMAEQARQVTNLPISVIPNFMGDDQVAYSSELAQARDQAGNRRNGRIAVGYFSGSPSHVRDFGLVAGALRQLLWERSDVDLRIVGHLDLEDTDLAGMEDRVERLPLVHYLELQRLIAQTEISLSPLELTRFNNCKSELKYFDAGAVSVPTIASATYTMSAAITSGVNGLICDDYDWLGALTWLIDNYDSAGVEMGRQARQHCLDTYTPRQVVSTIVSVVKGDEGH
ncbi:MAG: hypothetical protein FWF25_00255 [Propionibacteriaceae bacterium]|nr:hypothetical protein [Propionibacteriaceae bacterium]